MQRKRNMRQNDQAKTTILYFRGVGSNKTYEVYLRPARVDQNAWIVVAKYGPIGGTMNPGDVTKKEETYEAALKVYESTIKKKKLKGYTTDKSVYYGNYNDVEYAINIYKLEVENAKLKHKFREVIGDTKAKKVMAL